MRFVSPLLEYLNKFKLCNGIKTDDDKKKFDELVKRYEDIITTQENEI